MTINNISKTKCIENVDPILPNVVIGSSNFDTENLGTSDFKPDLNSPVFDSGNNSYVTGIQSDIIGNSRIFNKRIVDIGAYELQAHILIFTSNEIRSVYQDKLTLIDIESEQVFKSSDRTFSDLYNDFYNNEGYRLDFSRESKIIILLKTDEKEFDLLSDKEMVLVHEFEAFYDNTNLAIVITKNQNLFGDLFNIMFNDSRYLFRFNEIEHKLSVYIVDTYNKGASGDKNLINNVRFGGAPVLTS